MPVSLHSGELHILHIDAKPTARSYDGHDWEWTQESGAALGLECDAGTCVVTNIPANSVHTVTLHTAPEVAAPEKASRFLVQATFGPTRATLQSFDASDAGITSWIGRQMALPPTLHREYYRRRANPRQATALPTGGLRAACEAGSRWHRMAFSRADEGKTLQVGSTASGGDALRLELRIDGELRTAAR